MSAMRGSTTTPCCIVGFGNSASRRLSERGRAVKHEKVKKRRHPRQVMLNGRARVLCASYYDETKDCLRPSTQGASPKPLP